MEPENLVLSPEYIFVDTNEEIYIAYMEGYHADVADELAKITEEIIHVMDHTCRAQTFLVYGIHKICREENFTLNKLEKYLEQSDHEERQEIPISNAVTKEPAMQKKITYKPKKAKGQWLIMMVALIGIFWYLGWLDWLWNASIVKEWYKIGIVLCMTAGGAAIYKTQYKKEKITKYESQSPDVQLYLKPVDAKDPSIKIEESPYYIGNDEQHVEGVILQNDVSDVHVKIIMEEMAIYIIDQESDGGTAVNEHRLVPWECHRLWDGDIIDISSHRYQAIVSSCR